MSIFSNIAFLEGEQAEAYKKRKAKEKEEAERKDRDFKEKQINRANQRSEKEDDYEKTRTINRKYHALLDRDEKRRQREELEALKTVHKDPDKYFRARSNTLNGQIHQDDYPDSITKHIAKHPEHYKESGIFESVSFINE